MKAYLTKDLNNPTKYRVEYKTHPLPDDIIVPIDPLTGKPEEAQWLQIELIADPLTGEMVRTATVNSIIKDPIIAQRALDASAAAQQATTDKLTEDALYQFLLTFDENSIKDINDLKLFAKNVKDYFLFKYREEIKSRTGGVI